jgi:putative salt-induced outer membrane protein YdiY
MRLFLTTVLLSCAFASADAAEVRIRDGSVIIGTILSLQDSEDLIVDTEYMDEVTIEWESIESIRGTQVIEVELFNGQRLFGEVVLDDRGLSIVGDETTVTLPRDRIFSIAEVNENFWEGLDVYTDVGMNLVRGNNEVTQLSFGAGIGYDGRNFETSVDATTIVNEQTEGQDLRRATLAGNYTYRLPRNWQASGLLQFESDDQQGLNLRTLYGGAIGNRVYNQRRMRIDLYTGLVVNHEEFEGQRRTDSLEGLVGAAYRLRSARGIDIDASLSVLPSLEQSDRLRMQFDGSLSIDLFADLDFKLTVYDRYDSQPPEGNDTNDTGLTLGLSWSY